MEFEDLLQQAEQLNADIDSASELPRVECTFPQLVEKGQRLWSRTVGSNAAPQIGDAPAGAPAGQYVYLCNPTLILHGLTKFQDAFASSHLHIVVKILDSGI